MTGRKDFTRPRDARCEDCVCIEETSRTRISVDEQRAQQYDRFLRGRQIAHMIYGDFRATGAWEAVQGVPDQFSFRLQQQVKYLQKRSWRVQKKAKLQVSVRRQTVFAVYEQKNVRNNEPPNYSRLKTIARRQID